MRVPQEISDAIIDNFAKSHIEKISLTSYRREPDDADSLRACSLTSRAFLCRSCMHLFAAIYCEYHSDFLNLDRLLAECPHIGELYIRYFVVELRNRTSHLLAEDVVVPRILSRLRSLTHVTLTLPSTYGVWPSLFKAGMRATLSLHCLRSLSLYHMHFANASELELLLSHATGSKALTLGAVVFDNPSIHCVDVPHEGRVVLESLELELETDVMDAMMSGFSTVDIKHLKSLVIVDSSIIPLLKETAETIHKVRVSVHPTPPRELPDPDILKGNQTLHMIEINEDISKMVSILQQFGHLSHLIALKTISLDFMDTAEDASPSTAADWPELDAILSPAVDRLEDIHIHTEHLLDVGLVKSLLPSVGEKIALHVHH
ncbi:hypothetical protein C8J57DRAFT_1529018 [Mycena rebaudengoi]|nr:hypothetical protein C8J57DRAFT_1529018 [Mycena rebaudengoi]